MDTLKKFGSKITGGARAALSHAPKFTKKKRFYIPALLVLVLVGGYYAFAKPVAPQFETATVARQDVVRIVSQTGTVKPAEEASLSFTTGGRIQQVYVKEGQSVTRGQLLATLDSSAAYANLLSAQARLAQQQATYSASGASLGTTQSAQDQYVENAHRDLVSGDLHAYLVRGGSENALGSYTPPTITGTYTCAPQGTYQIELYASAAQSGGTMRYHGLEEGIMTVSTVQPVPLGHCGLYIQFPPDFVVNPNILWEVPIPNVRSSTYQARLNAYNAAVENRRQTLQSANQAPVLSAGIAEARAAVLGAQAQLAETRLLAPFTGTVTTVDAVRGSIASPGTPAVGLISSNAFEITVEVPEGDIGQLHVGNTADVTFDAYDNVHLKANVSYIAPQASSASGASAFKVTLQFDEPDERIRAGLSANVDITASQVKNVIAVPTRAIVEEDGVRYARLLTGPATYRQVPVTTGLSGGGSIEITEGLKEGDKIITFANQKALATLTKEQ